MGKRTRQAVVGVIDSIIRLGVMFILAITFIIMGVAMWDSNNSQELYKGSFSTVTLDRNWILVSRGAERKVDLPLKLGTEKGEEIELVNSLPDDLSDGMSLMIRANMQDVTIYVDEEKRVEYTTEAIKDMTYYIPSAYVVIDLNAKDSGKIIRMVICPKEQPVVNEVRISYGNNVWFDVIKKGLPASVFAVIILILGVLMVVAAFVLRKYFNANTALNLGFLMINIALWIISESALRQFIFSRPSLSMYFSYILVELIGVMACLYFDEVQHRVYHRLYLVAECIVLGQLVLNVGLDILNIAELYVTMKFFHMWIAFCAVLAIVTIVIDIYTKRGRTYAITLIGMVCFIILSLNELVGFYLNRFHMFGGSICIAMLFLMVATIIQTVYDEVTGVENREKIQTAMTINTIQTIAGAIDARDEYTGGHSERVGFYASRLAREMAADYDLAEEDILRVHYIGLVHDIGKIGVADTVLNKSGRLTDEEFSLMKKHTEIGYEIMSSLGQEIKGVLDGIRYHHERFDGLGYPDGLSDTDIPLIARILALADSYDAMTSNRVYRKRLTDEQVREEILKNSGTQFDPALAEIFIRLIDRKELSVMTVEGAAADLWGVVRKSSILEDKLQRDLLDKVDITNPTHIRMLCYIMKLMEKKGKEYIVYFASAKSMEKLEAQIKENTSNHDVFLLYTDEQYIIALYDKTEEEKFAFINNIQMGCPDVKMVDIMDSLES
ncbi:MAG: HD-GYP domain-containing protein [Pseudobutyrivibrio sp.]|nr:HD-GYP domain-containing protein [Pseudobutyrivibrio sp.]